MPQRFPWDADSQSVIANAGLDTMKSTVLPTAKPGISEKRDRLTRSEVASLLQEMRISIDWGARAYRNVPEDQWFPMDREAERQHG